MITETREREEKWDQEEEKEELKTRLLSIGKEVVLSAPTALTSTPGLI